MLTDDRQEFDFWISVIGMGHCAYNVNNWFFVGIHFFSIKIQERNVMLLIIVSASADYLCWYDEKIDRDFLVTAKEQLQPREAEDGGPTPKDWYGG
jgi:hypothetical protein